MCWILRTLFTLPAMGPDLKSQEARASLQPGRLRLMPSSELRAAWKQDHDAMRESMFFGEAPTFDDILTAVAAFERRFNVGGS